MKRSQDWSADSDSDEETTQTSDTKRDDAGLTTDRASKLQCSSADAVTHGDPNCALSEHPHVALIASNIAIPDTRPKQADADVTSANPEHLDAVSKLHSVDESSTRPKPSHLHVLSDDGGSGHECSDATPMAIRTSEDELDTGGQKSSNLAPQLYASMTPKQKPRNHLEGVEEEQLVNFGADANAGLLSPPRSRRPTPGCHVRYDPQRSSSLAMPYKAVESSILDKVEEVYASTKNHGVDDLMVEEIHKPASHLQVPNARIEAVRRRTGTGREDSQMQQTHYPRPVKGSSYLLEKACSNALRELRQRNQHHELETPGNYDDASRPIVDRCVAHTSAEIQKHLGSGRCSTCTDEPFQEYYIGDVPGPRADDRDHDETDALHLRDAILSYSARMSRLLATDAHPGSVCSAATADTASVHQIESASDCGTFVSSMGLVDDKLDGHSGGNPVHTIGSVVGDFCSQEGNAADAGAPYPPRLGTSPSLDAIRSGFAAYYWKEAIADHSILETSEGRFTREGTTDALGDGSLNVSFEAALATLSVAEMNQVSRVLGSNAESRAEGAAATLGTSPSMDAIRSGFAAYYWKETIADYSAVEIPDTGRFTREATVDAIGGASVEAAPATVPSTELHRFGAGLGLDESEGEDAPVTLTSSTTREPGYSRNFIALFRRSDDSFQI